MSNNQATSIWAQRETPELLSVNAPHVLLDELDESRISNHSAIKHLVVIADMVEIQGAEVSLPGSLTISLVCRIFRVQQGAGSAVLKLRSLEPEWGYIAVNRRFGAQIDIYANQLQGRMQVHQPVVRYMADGVTRHVVDLIWAVAPYANASQSQPATLTVQGRVLSDPHAGDDGSHQTFIVQPPVPISESEQWHRNFRVIVPPSPAIAFSDVHMILAVEAGLVKVETILISQADATQMVDAAVRHAQSLSQLLLERYNSGSNLLQRIFLQQLFRAQAVLKLPFDRSKPYVVPGLQYKRYGSEINTIAREAASYMVELKKLSPSIGQLNHDVRGRELLAMKEAFVAKERAMDFPRVAEVVGVHELGTRRQDWMRQLEKLQVEMERAKGDMNEGLMLFRDRSDANALFAILNAVATVGLAIFTGGETVEATVEEAILAVNQASSTIAERLQNVIKTLQILLGVMEVLAATNNYLSRGRIEQMIIARVMPELPSEEEWSVFEDEVEAVAADILMQPGEDVSAVATWKAKCKNMAVLCRTLTSSATHMAVIQSSLRMHQTRKDIATIFRQHLPQMRPAENFHDFAQLVSLMEVQNSRILVQLLETLVLQNGGLGYEYFFPVPPPASGWPKMENVNKALAATEDDAAQYLLTQVGPASNFTAIYTVSAIPVGLLQNHDDWIFTVPINAGSVTVFSERWSRLRLQSVQMRFSPGVHQPTTDGDQVSFLLEGAPAIQDRRKQDILRFIAEIPARYHYAYHLGTGDTVPATDHQVSHPLVTQTLTPFTQWRLRLPRTTQNQGLEFPTALSPTDTTAITISFFFSRITTDW